jgi:hypothetical protein
MTGEPDLQIEYQEIGICGLSCRLCPKFHIDGPSRCGGCKSKNRILVGCPFITCAVKRKGIEFCWECDEHSGCEKWKGHREYGKSGDTFKCYQKLEDNIDFMMKHGVSEFEWVQKKKEEVLKEMLLEFNEGRSKSYYCIAATIFDIDELIEALAQARKESKGLPIKEKSKVLHSILDSITEKRNYHLKLRK